MKSVAFRAAVITAAIYGYFLIFAQFAFVELIRAGNVPGSLWSADIMEKAALGLMALAGIAAGFTIAWKGVSPQKIRLALLLAGVSSLAAPWLNHSPGCLLIALATGAALGVATVSLATLLPQWCGVQWIGLGTGMGYAFCNLPWVFSQSSAHQSWIASSLALLGLIAVPSLGNAVPDEVDRPVPARVFPFWGVLVLFTALVWLDSAAFFIIQHTTDLRSATWRDELLWRNAAIHLITAVFAGLWLKQFAARGLPLLAWLFLAIAAIAVNHGSSRPLAGWLYPAAVSLYSTALVAWPAWFSGVTSQRDIAWRAAWLYGVAGWFGSANGIGMAQTLQRIPSGFILISGACVTVVVVAASLRQWRTAVAIAAVLIPAFLFKNKPESLPGESSIAFERGKQVYLSEGCITCHSQYIRPGTADEIQWGPVRPPEEILAARPVVIGNRRQGPDLTNVGARRSSAWLKLHLIDPRAFSPGSPMPSYAHLFESRKGDDLVTYLKQSGESHTLELMEKIQAWSPSDIPSASDGGKLFTSQCAACHGPAGLGNGPLSSRLGKPPANLVAGPFIYTPAGPDQAIRLARTIKFGIPGTEMPGHEPLEDASVLALRDYVLGLRAGY